MWNSYFKFCVDRNPWDKVVSNYYMIKNRSKSPLSFNEFVKTYRLPRNLPLYTDRRGRVIVDRVVKYENLNAQLAEIFDQLGIAFDGTLEVRAKSAYRTERRDYRAYFDAELEALVADGCRDEIALNGYRF